MKTINFISTFAWYEKEESGVKPNTIRDMKVYERAKAATHIRIQKGYTAACFVRKITDVSLFEDRVIISWNPNIIKKTKD